MIADKTLEVLQVKRLNLNTFCFTLTSDKGKTNEKVTVSIPNTVYLDNKGVLKPIQTAFFLALVQL